MFLFQLTYQKPICEVERFLDQHIGFLDSYYESGNFICSGRKHPRTGGIILCSCGSRAEAEEILQKDPFYLNGIAEYEVTEFIPSKCTDAFQLCMEKTERR